jgi:hypothetical protein
MEAAVGFERRASRGIGRRGVDALVSLRRAGERLRLGGASGVLLLLPTLALALALMSFLLTGLVVSIIHSFHRYDRFMLKPGQLSVSQYTTVLTTRTSEKCF